MERLKDHIRCFARLHWRDLLFFIFAVLSVAGMLFLLSEDIGDPSLVKLRLTLYVADALLFLSCYWLVGPKFRWLSVVVIWLIAIFAFANALYFRYWGDLLPLPSIFVPYNYNVFVVKSIGSLLRHTDMIYLLMLSVATIIYLWLKPGRQGSFSIRLKAVAIAVTLFAYAFAFIGSANSMRRWYEDSGQHGVSLAECIGHRYDALSTQSDMWVKNGLSGYLISQIVNYPESGRIELSDDERRSVDEFIALSRSQCELDSCFVENKSKNLIFIIVESLNAWTIGKKYGNNLLTPVMTSLCEAEGNISNLCMLPQINDGGSSDGQLIYNTGLLPLKRGVAVISHADNSYPSLVKALKPASSAEFIVESASVYNHRRSSRSFGYDTIYDRRSLLESGWDVAVSGADDAVLTFALETIAGMPQPFFAEVTTLTMHYPFEIEGFEPVEWIDSVAPDDYYLNHYLQTVHYTDAAIGRFLDGLAESGLSENTIVVIASDHDEATRQRVGNANPADDNAIVFMVLGAGRTFHETAVPMGQIDVFPTVLDIMGVRRDDCSWRGLGRSILANDRYKAAVSRTGRLDGLATPDEEHRLRRAFDVADSIIRSDYFAD